MYRITSRAVVLALAAGLLLPIHLLRAQPPSPATAQPPAIAASDRDAAARLLDEIQMLLEGTLGDSSGKSDKQKGLKGAGTVQVPRATIDETLALVSQIKTMLKRAQP